MSGNDLHLPNLTVRRFRGIPDLSIEHLGRVNLIAGKNGIGKTTVLDAVRTYAARGQLTVLSGILSEREELTRMVNEEGDEVVAPDWEALFYGWRVSPSNPIVIGPTGSDQSIRIKTRLLNKEEADAWGRVLPERVSDVNARMISVMLADSEQATPLFISDAPWLHKAMAEDSGFPAVIRCESLGPSVLSNTDIGRLWDKVALTDDESLAVDALRLIFGDTVERAAVIGDVGKSRHGRRALVRIAGQERPVPLRSLGDGAVRLFGVALALANSQGGFLLIDEAENGIHYSLQRDFWRMVLLTAQANNVQVFATTHSWDCMAGFAQAAVDAEDVEGALVRLENDGENIRAVEYSERQLQVAAEQGIEVR
jgi:predicted ATPase